MRITFLSLLALSAIFQVSAFGQIAKIEVKDLKVEAQQTPQIQAANVPDKKWKPKTWIEIAMELKTKLPTAAGGNDASLPSMEVKYYLATTQRTKEGKPIVLTGTITYLNVPAGESNTLAFVSPSTLKRVLQKDNGGKADIPTFGVEVRAGGEVLAVKSSNGGVWWVDADKQPLATVAYEDGAVLAKNKTPFAPLWGDYDVPAADK